MMTSGWLTYWNPVEGLRSARAAKCANVCLFHYEVTGGGGIRDLWADNVSKRDLDAIRQSRIPYLVSTTTTMNGQDFLRMLSGGKALRALAQAHVELASRYGAVGVDLDWESINFGTAGESNKVANTLVLFVQELRSALGGMSLSVTVPGRTMRAPGDWAVYDYAALGRIADQLRLMAYDYHEASSAPGPVAPVDYVKDVLEYASARVEPRKLVLGVAGYGYDWSGPGAGVNVSARNAPALESKPDARAAWQSGPNELRILYPGHEAWISTGESIRKRARVAEKYGVPMVSVWSLGEEDPGTWPLP